jgi:hypothetical protein
MKSLVRDIVEQITVAADRIEIRLSRAKVAAALEAGASQRHDLDHIILSIEANLRRAGKGKRLVIENGAEAEVNAGLTEVAPVSAASLAGARSHDSRAPRGKDPLIAACKQNRGEAVRRSRTSLR